AERRKRKLGGGDGAPSIFLVAQRDAADHAAVDRTEEVHDFAAVRFNEPAVDVVLGDRLHRDFPCRRIRARTRLMTTRAEPAAEGAVHECPHVALDLPTSMATFTLASLEYRRPIRPRPPGDRFDTWEASNGTPPSALFRGRRGRAALRAGGRATRSRP